MTTDNSTEKPIDEQKVLDALGMAGRFLNRAEKERELNMPFVNKKMRERMLRVIKSVDIALDEFIIKP